MPTPTQLTILSQKFNLSKKTITKIHDSFNSFDLDNDGCITAEELKSFIDLIGTKIPPEEISKIISNIDKNSDNVIQFEEYVEILAPNAEYILNRKGDGKTRVSIDDTNAMVPLNVDKVKLQAPSITIGMVDDEGYHDSNQNMQQTTNLDTTLLNDFSENSQKIRKISYSSNNENFSSGISSSGQNQTGSTTPNPPYNNHHTGSSTTFKNQDSYVTAVSPKNKATGPAGPFELAPLAVPTPLPPVFPVLTSKDLFNIYDRDKNGWITKDEVETVMNNLGENLSKEDLEEMMFGKDKITYADFVKLTENCSVASGSSSLRGPVESRVASLRPSVNEQTEEPKEKSGAKENRKSPKNEPKSSSKSKTQTQSSPNLIVTDTTKDLEIESELDIEIILADRTDLILPRSHVKQMENKRDQNDQKKKKRKSKCSIM